MRKAQRPGVRCAGPLETTSLLRLGHSTTLLKPKQPVDGLGTPARADPRVLRECAS